MTPEALRKTRSRESEWILRKLSAMKPLAEAGKVAAFYPLPTEPDIRPLLETLAREGRLLLPRTFENGEMDFVQIRDLAADLIEGYYHICEPRRDSASWNGDIPFFLVPGVQFSRDGARKGHGKGYYDRFLKKFPHALKCGVAYSSQISGTPLATKPHDVPMNYIVAPEIKEKI